MLKTLQVPGLPGTGPGTAPRASANKANKAKEGKGREGKGRERRKEGKERGRQGAGLRRGKERACGADGWMDRWTGKGREQEIERREGTEGSRQNQKRERNERVAWTAVVGVCFIDRT